MTRIVPAFAASLLAVLALAACSEPAAPPPDPGAEVDANGFRAPTETTLRVQAEAARALPDAAEELAIARRGLIASVEDLHITAQDGSTVWRPADYGFLNAEAPGSVHPGLWRREQLNGIHGLFEVAPGIHQVRGYDLSNMSIIEGETGRIIIDPLTAEETARAALELVEAELGERPVVAVIFTHSHIDHFGGVGGVINVGDVGPGGVRVIAPEGFTLESVSENVMAGQVMGRRADFMFGAPLPEGVRGHVGSGLGRQPAYGGVSIAPVTDTITRTGQTITIDGVEMVFQHAPDTEARAELTVYFPQFDAWCGAEIVSRNMHNLYTPRGAQVRDALAWTAAIEEARRVFWQEGVQGSRMEVIFNSHHWPVWGREESAQFLEVQRDLYKYIHDQTLRLANQGLTPDEIADAIELPEQLAGPVHARGYYGALKANSRAVYQRYFGWYDAVPAHLDRLPRTEVAQRYVEAMGGLDAVLAQVEQAYEDGEMRWAAELAQHAAFAAPRNEQALEWLARAYEQLGYRAESGPWRDIYLTGAWEARHGVVARDLEAGAGDLLDAIPLDLFFAAMATRLDGMEAARNDRRFQFHFSDVDEYYVLEVSNGVMRHRAGRAGEEDELDATVTLTRAFWMRLLRQEAGLADMIGSSDFAVQGDRLALFGFFGLLEQPEPGFAIITP